MAQVPPLLEQMGTLLDTLQDAYEVDLTESTAADKGKDQQIVNLNQQNANFQKQISNLQKQNGELQAQKQQIEKQLGALQSKIQSLFGQ